MFNRAAALPDPVSLVRQRLAGRTPPPSDHAMGSLRPIPYPAWFAFVDRQDAACAIGQEVFGGR
jgi:hypothetical protein